MSERPRPEPKFTWTLKLLLDWSAETHGRFLLMGLALLFIGGVLTLGSYWLRDKETGQFHVWTKFFMLSGICLAAGACCWVWKKVKGGRGPLDS